MQSIAGIRTYVLSLRGINRNWAARKRQFSPFNTNATNKKKTIKLAHSTIKNLGNFRKIPHHLRITKEIKEYFLVWLDYFDRFNGFAVFQETFWISVIKLPEKWPVPV